CARLYLTPSWQGTVPTPEVSYATLTIPRGRHRAGRVARLADRAGNGQPRSLAAVPLLDARRQGGLRGRTGRRRTGRRLPLAGRRAGSRARGDEDLRQPGSPPGLVPPAPRQALRAQRAVDRHPRRRLG